MFERAGLLFIFNFHHTNSFTDYRVGVEVAGDYKIVLSSDDKQYGGWDRVDLTTTFVTTALEWNNRKNFLQVCAALALTRRRVIQLILLSLHRSTSHPEFVSFSL